MTFTWKRRILLKYQYKLSHFKTDQTNKSGFIRTYKAVWPGADPDGGHRGQSPSQKFSIFIIYAEK